ncbi:MAG: type II secretion system protein GspG [Planctomycetota bacterium]
MQHRKLQGFTLIEMVVVVAIIAAMAAILVPVISDELVSSERSHALGDTQRIAAAITQYVKDTRLLPTGPDGDNTINWMFGTGNLPAVNPFDDGDSDALLDYLTDGAANGGAKWNGPYLQEIPEDPWGNAYVVNTHGYFQDGEYVWVLSAGPNGDIDTAVDATAPAGDDIGILID